MVRRIDLRENWYFFEYNRRHEADMLKGHWHENGLPRVGYEPTTSPLHGKSRSGTTRTINFGPHIVDLCLWIDTLLHSL